MAPLIPSEKHLDPPADAVLCSPGQEDSTSAEDTGEEEEVYSIYTGTARNLIVLTASVAGFFSPLSANIYLPALDTLADELHVSDTMINLTVTTYMVCRPATAQPIPELTV